MAPIKDQTRLMSLVHDNHKSVALIRILIETY